MLLNVYSILCPSTYVMIADSRTSIDPDYRYYPGGNASVECGRPKKIIVMNTGFRMNFPI